jgi:RES domain-containing protein
MRVRAESQLNSLSRAPLQWKPAVRVVPLFPPIAMLEQLDPALQAAALAEVASVSPDILGNLALLPSGPLPTGGGASRIITSFTFSKPARFNDPTFAAFYGAESLGTAISETVHHITGSLQDVKAPPQTLPTRVALHVEVNAIDVLDARPATYAEIYDPNVYVESRFFGALARGRGVQGIAFRSVRRPGGECVAVYTHTVLANCREDRELVYRYDGANIEVSEVHYSSGP